MSNSHRGTQTVEDEGDAMDAAVKKHYSELRELAQYIEQRPLDSTESVVLLAHAAGLSVGTDLAMGAITREDAEKTIRVLTDHMRNAAGLGSHAKTH